MPDFPQSQVAAVRYDMHL